MFCAAPRPTNRIPYNAIEIISSLRLPILGIIQPIKGNEHINPDGMANNTPPNPASDKCMNCLIVGMRDAQLAKHRPDIKNIAATAILNDKRDLITGRKVVVSIGIILSV